jgi:hypothetical protein
MIGPLLTVVVLCGLCLRSDLWLYVRPGRVTRGKWSISDAKGESDLFSCPELRRL